MPTDIKRPLKTVTARDLARNLSKVVDSVGRDGTTFLVTRHGRAVARIEPVGNLAYEPAEDRSPIADRLEEAAGCPPAPEVDVDALDLGDAEKELLLVCEPRALVLPLLRIAAGLTTTEASVVVFRLEMKDLVVRNWDGYRLTAEGQVVQGALRAEPGPQEPGRQID